MTSTSLQKSQTIGELFAGVRYTTLLADSLSYSGLVSDSRQVEEGTVFACSGAAEVKRDAYLEQAVDRGAAALIVDAQEKLEGNGSAIFCCRFTPSVKPYCG